jgi:hypothetical protein
VTIYTIYANTNDHCVTSLDVSSWTTARAGGTLSDSGTNLTLGATFNGSAYRARQAFFQFDLSSVPSFQKRRQCGQRNDAEGR